jgi:hypothetical protein
MRFRLLTSYRHENLPLAVGFALGLERDSQGRPVAHVARESAAGLAYATTNE